jgi:hypothetical protein
MRGLMRLWAALDALADVDSSTLERWRRQLQELFGFWLLVVQKHVLVRVYKRGTAVRPHSYGFSTSHL